MLFKYKGLNREGKRTKGTISASSLEDAKTKLRLQGIYYDALKEAREFTFEGFSSRRVMPNTVLSNFAKELASYLKAGNMTILTALKMMEKQHKKEKHYHAFLNATKTMVDEGKPLSVALNEQKAYKLPEFFLQSVKVAAQGGKMVEVLTNMSEFFASQSRIRQQVINSMIYPSFILIVAMGMTVFLLIYVVPKITGIFDDTHQELPGITKFVLSASDFLGAHYVLIMGGLLGLIVVSKIAYSKVKAFHYGVDALMLRLPVVGKLTQNHELGRFSYIISLMLDSGVPYTQAVTLASSTFGNLAIRDLFETVTKKVTEGNKLSNALYSAKGVKLKSNFLQNLALGEESSNVSAVMGNLSELYGEENEQGIDRLLKMVEPVMMLLIGAIVGVIVMAMLLPIFSMSLGAKL
jgi:general secretion pathway protein F/type IV pilus assembly protein PilC